MTSVTFTVAVALTLGLASCSSAGDPPPPMRTTAPASELPREVEEFRGKVARMNADQVLAAATARFGRPSRDAGSGVSIPQWDIAGGVLTVHSSAGPTFRSAGGKT